MRKFVQKVLVVMALAAGFVATMPFTTYAATSGASDVVVQQIQGPTLADKFASRAESSWPWYVTRASGFVAAISLFLLMLSGIGHITGDMFRFLEPLTAWATHRALGIAFGVSVLVHMLALLFDHFVPFNIWQILVPWLSGYQPVTLFGVQLGSLWVALGVLAFYLVATIIITSLLWVDKKPRLWKFIHLLSYLVLIFVFVHALYLGTDLASGWLRWVWILVAVGVAGAVVFRLWRAKTV